VTQGFGEFSATTGKLITILGAWRAPVLSIRVLPPQKFAVNVITFPYLLWASPDAKILIGEVGGHAFVVRDGHKQTIPWPAHIGGPDDAVAPGVAW
jgi:hypothetical protein